MNKFIIPTFGVLVGISLFILSQFFVPAIRELFQGSFLFLVPIILFSLLGLVLVVLTVKEKIKGKLRKFLILTGASAAGFFVFVFLHNLFYGLEVVTSRIISLSYLMEILHMIFFIVAIFICPVGFLVGVVGSFVQLIKKKKT